MSDLREQYADALAATNTLDKIDLEYTLDQVMSIRDSELEQLKDDALVVVAESAQERDAWRARAEQAEAAVERMRKLIDSYPPGSDFVRSGAARIFRGTLDGTLGQS